MAESLQKVLLILVGSALILTGLSIGAAKFYISQRDANTKQEISKRHQCINGLNTLYVASLTDPNYQSIRNTQLAAEAQCIIDYPLN